MNGIPHNHDPEKNALDWWCDRVAEGWKFRVSTEGFGKFTPKRLLVSVPNGGKPDEVQHSFIVSKKAELIKIVETESNISEIDEMVVRRIEKEANGEKIKWSFYAGQ